MVKVSIIVPVYNCAPFLSRCLDSLVNQTLKDIEIICVNDGSMDNSLEILNNFSQKDSRIIVIDKENEGQSVARNVAIEIAKGDYLGFVDADDWVDLEYFEKLYNSAIKHDCDIACAGFKRCKSNKNKISKSFDKEVIADTIEKKIILDNLPAHNYIWNKIYRREAWREIGIKFTPKRYYEDMALMIKILHKMGKMVTVPNVYYNYRLNSFSTCAQKTSKHSCDYKWAINELTKYAQDNDIYLNFDNIVQKKVYYKIFNLTLMKIYHYESLRIYKLLGFIPFGKQLTV